MEDSLKLIEKIRKQEMKPIPKWRFHLRNTLIWGLFILSVLLGSLAFSVILFSIQQIDFDLVSHLTHSLYEFLLGMLPIFWILALVVLLGIAFVSIRNSKKGYKRSSLGLMGYSMAFSMLLGTLFFISGGAQWLEKAFAMKVSIYESVQEKKVRIWTDPDNGYLSGTITNTGDHNFILRDFYDNEWTIAYEQPDISPAVLLERGEMIKIIGEKTGDGHFRADMIRPWGGPAWMQEGNKKFKRKNERK